MFTAMAAVLFREMLEAHGGLLRWKTSRRKLNKWILYFGKTEVARDHAARLLPQGQEWN